MNHEDHHDCCGGKEGNISRQAAAPSLAKPGQWTCPMDPEVVSDKPGDCPKCGMPLEPMTPVSGDEHAQREIRSLSRKFWTGLILTIPVLLLAMGDMIPGVDLHSLIPKSVSKWIELALATPVVFWAGGIFFVRGWRSITARGLNMFTLIMIGVGAAWLFSTVAVLEMKALIADLESKK